MASAVQAEVPMTAHGGKAGQLAFSSAAQPAAVSVAGASAHVGRASVAYEM